VTHSSTDSLHPETFLAFFAFFALPTRYAEWMKLAFFASFAAMPEVGRPCDDMLRGLKIKIQSVSLVRKKRIKREKLQTNARPIDLACARFGA
jgi:hypothetical protein